MSTPTPQRLLLGLGLLTFVTGALDAASVLGLGHVFTANMTGNVVFIGFALAGTGRVSVPVSLVALAGFLLGAMLAARAVRRGLRFSAVLLTETVALATAALVLVQAPLPLSQLVTYVAVGLLGAAMGAQNAAVRALAVPDMTTTVLTLTLTGLAADSRLAGGDAPRTRRRLASVLLMLCGALCGALLMRYGPFMPVGLAAALVGAAALSARGT